MATIDLDAAKAARHEAHEEPHIIRFGGRDFLMPAEPPFETFEQAISIAEGLDGTEIRDADAQVTLRGIRDLLASLLGDQWNDFRALRPSFADLVALAGQIPLLYGFDSAGESEASGGSSESISSPSRPTSNGSTDSIYAGNSTAPKPSVLDVSAR